MSNREFEHYLDQYAEVIVRVGVNLQADQRLLIRVPVDLAPFARLLTRHAYAAGARFVEVLWSDQRILWSHLKFGPENVMSAYEGWGEQLALDYIDAGDAMATIYALDPDMLADIDPARVHAARQQIEVFGAPILQRIMQNRVKNGGFFSAAFAGWATKVFPDDGPEAAVAKLWDAIFAACRVKAANPIAGWQTHLSNLEARAHYLNKKQYAALHYQAPGTDLTVGLPAGHVWHSIVNEETGIRHVPNIPSEEIYTLPHHQQVAGTVTVSRPLSWQGTTITGLVLTFMAGEVVDAQAETGEELVQMLLDTDDGARALGEVALVPHSSPISQSGLRFYNSLYDENAASHLALGEAYRTSLTGGTALSDDEFTAAGGNRSSIHVDFMIGSAALSVTGTTAAGERETIMKHGEWAFDV